MTDAGFFRGTNSEQDTRFSDKQKKLLKTMKFADILSEKVNMKKVKLDTIKPWIATKITELLNLEDEVVVEYVFTQLEATVVDPKMMQINLTGFLNGKNAREFMRELWEYLVSAQKNPSGIPEKFIEAKKLELRERELEQGRVSAAIRKTKDSIDLLAAPAQKETADGPKPILADGRDETRKKSPVQQQQQQQQRRSPFRQRFRSPQRTFQRRSPSPRRQNRRSGSRDGRRSPAYGGGGGGGRNQRRPSPAYRRPSPSYRRPARRSRSRSDSRSPKRMKGRNSPLARRSRSRSRSRSPLGVRGRNDGGGKTVARKSSSSSSRSPLPSVGRRPAPRSNGRARSTSSSASSPDVKKETGSPVAVVEKRASPQPAAASDVAARPVSAKSELSQISRNKPLAEVKPYQPSNDRPVTGRNRERSRSRSASRSPVGRRGRNDRPSPPRYRQRSISPRNNRRSLERKVSRERSRSPRNRGFRNSSPDTGRKNGNGRPVDTSRTRNDFARRPSPPRNPPRTDRRPPNDDSTDRRGRDPSPGLRDVGKIPPSGDNQQISKVKEEEPTVAGVGKSASPPVNVKASGVESATEDKDEEQSGKKAKKAKKDKKHKKHKKHRKEKKSSKRKDITPDEASTDIEQKLRARALECLRKDETNSS